MAISLVQFKASTGIGTPLVNTAAMDNDVVAGNLLVGMSRMSATLDAFDLLITDTLGNTYHIFEHSTSTGNTGGSLFWTIASGSGANTVTAEAQGSSGGTRVAIAEFSGINGTSPLHVAPAGTSGTGASATMNDIISTIDNTLFVYSMWADGGTSFTPTGGSTKITDVSSDNVRAVLAYEILATAQTKAGTADLSASDSWGAAGALFTGDGGAGGDPDIPFTLPFVIGNNKSVQVELNQAHRGVPAIIKRS